MIGQKVKDEVILESYKRTGNIWKTGNELCLTGQFVWARLKKLNIPRSIKHWTEDEISKLRILYDVPDNENIKLSDFAKEIGRLKSNVCKKARELGLNTSYKRETSLEQRKTIGLNTKKYIKKKGHPRGYREIRICPVCGGFFDTRHSWKQECCSQACAGRKRMLGVNVYSRARSGRREDLGNMFFRSTYEANYARYLNYVIANGNDIITWEYEPDTFEFKKIKRGTRFYTPDFKIHLKNGHIEYHEVKGWDYPKGKTSRKRFAKYYPHLKLILIDDDFFKALKRQGVNSLIENWE